MFFGYNYVITTPSAPGISIYAEHCISYRRHVKRRMRQYGRV